jgi:hypothetical protein
VPFALMPCREWPRSVTYITAVIREALGKQAREDARKQYQAAGDCLKRHRG